MLRFAVCDLTGAAVADAANPLAGSQVVTPLNGRITGTLNLSFEDPAARFCYPLLRLVKCWFDGEIIACGPILKPRFDMAARTVQVPFFGDPSYRLERSFINNRGDTDFDTNAGVLPAMTDDPYTGPFPNIGGKDQADIVARLMEHAGVSAAEAAAGVPGIGIVRGSLQSGGVTRSRVYETGAQVLQQMLDMTGVIDGIDLAFTPLDRTDGILAKLDTYYPARGVDKSADCVFEYGLGLDNATNVVWEPSGDTVENRVTYQGQSNEGQPPNVYQSNMPESQLLFGVYQNYVGRSDVLYTTTLQALARDECSSHAFPIDSFEITPALDDGTGRLRDRETGAITRLDGRYGKPPKISPSGLWVGDTVGVRAYDRPTVEFEGSGRIYEITLSLDSDGATVPEIKATPSTIDVPVT